MAVTRIRCAKEFRTPSRQLSRSPTRTNRQAEFSIAGLWHGRRSRFFFYRGDSKRCGPERTANPQQNGEKSATHFSSCCTFLRGPYTVILRNSVDDNATLITPSGQTTDKVILSSLLPQLAMEEESRQKMFREPDSGSSNAMQRGCSLILNNVQAYEHRPDRTPGDVALGSHICGSGLRRLASEAQS